MRVVKEAEVRKNEILDAAAALFGEKGFDSTSTNDILDVVGIARGTLYHHFKSKEDIMDALIERQTNRLLARAREAAEDKSGSLEERMVRTIMALHVEETEHGEGQEMIQHLHNPQNALMHQKTQRILLGQVPAILAGILEDGIVAGVFDTPYPLEAMEIAVTYLNTVLDDDILELTPEQRTTKIQAFLFLMERMLGAKPGQFSLIQTMLGES